MNRRNFLAQSSLAGAGLFFGQGALAQNKAKVDDINIALIGVGAQGRILMDALTQIPGIRFKAVCDIWQPSLRYGEKKLKKYGHEVTGYKDFEDMLEKENSLDAAIIATPDFWHAPHTVACLNAGIHVYCEKMMSNTVEGARSMVKAMQESGKLLQIGHQRRSNPRYQHVFRNLIQNAELCGRITNINGQWNRAVTEDLGWPKKYAIPTETLKRYGYQDMHQFRNWRWFKDLSGGPISDLGAHQIDIFNWFMQTPPKTVMASGGSDYYKNREHDDNVMVIYEYDTPKGTCRAFYQVLTTTSAGGGYFERFMGDQGTIKISENPKWTQVYREAASPDWDHLIKKNYIRENKTAAPKKSDAAVDARETAELIAYDIPVVLNKKIHQPHLENFFDAIRGKAKLNSDGLHSFESEVPIFKVNEAVEAKRTLEITKADFLIG